MINFAGYVQQKWLADANICTLIHEIHFLSSFTIKTQVPIFPFFYY